MDGDSIGLGLYLPIYYLFLVVQVCACHVPCAVCGVHTAAAIRGDRALHALFPASVRDSQFALVLLAGKLGTVFWHWGTEALAVQ